MEMGGEFLSKDDPFYRTNEERKEAVKYAISSLETDEAYQLEYESTTKNDLALIHTWGLDEGIRCAMCTNSMKSDRGCDGSCVVNNAMYKEVMDVIENHIVDTDKKIEPTTKDNLVVDAVSREKAIKWAEFYTEIYDAKTANESIMKMLRDLPPATPQEPVIDKIRAEIEKEADASNRLGGIREIGLRKALKIIDKYKGESEET